jgi:hypothetical protein
MENPLILIHDKKISSMNSLLPALEVSIKVTLFIFSRLLVICYG